MKNIKRKGFTLVELLIVIVVIGILSAMMMLSSTEAVTSARASNIVSNLRNFKTAAMAMYVDYLDSMDKGNNPLGTGTFPATTTKNDDVDATLRKYMNKGDSNASDPETAHYHIVMLKAPNGGNGYYIWYDNAKDTRVRDKLAGRASSVGILQGVDASNAGETYKTGDNVYMFVTQCGDAS